MEKEISQTNEMNAQMHKQKRHSWFSNSTWILLLLMSTLLWQCEKDTFEGETSSDCPEVISSVPANEATIVVTNTAITATFNEVMLPSTINGETFTLKIETVPVSGIVTYEGLIATFTPTKPLEGDTKYSGTITKKVKDLAGNYLIDDYNWNFTTGSVPTIYATDPANATSSVPLNKIIKATFSREMIPATVNSATFKIVQDSTLIAGIVTYSAQIATFTPASPLKDNTVYTGIITTGATDTYGSAMAGDYTWSFSTAQNQNNINLSSNPVEGGSTSGGGWFSMNDQITVLASPVAGYIFTNWMEGTNIVSSNTNYAFTVTSNRTLVANFTIIAADTYTLDVTAVNGSVVKNPTTATYAQGTTVQLTASPDNGYVFSGWSGDANGSNNPLTVSMNSNKNITADFTLILPSTYTLNILSEDGTVVKNPNLVNYDQGATVQLTATPNSGYNFNFWSGDATSSSNTITVLMDQDKTITANYSLISTPGPDVVNLGSTNDFAILAGSGIANTGVSTMINGDVGSFPTATINGLLPENVNGTLYMSADPIIGLAKSDLTAAYNDAQSRSLDAISLPGQIGGLTLAPGLYVNSTTSGISGTGPNGILTLDAGGNADAVWIFKTGSTFVTDSGTSIVLAGGAQADNIYWSVGTSATLGTNSVFYGNILADQAITLTTGATLYGRALTRVAAISLDSNTVTKP